MKGLGYYYERFQRLLDSANQDLAMEFSMRSKRQSPREIFLWLEDLRREKLLPPEMEELLTDFYWEIA